MALPFHTAFAAALLAVAAPVGIPHSQRPRLRPGQNARGASSLSTVMQMVAAGYGVTLLPEICAEVEERDERVVLQRFESPKPARTVGLVWRKSSPRKEDCETLLETLRTTVSEAGCRLAS